MKIGPLPFATIAAALLAACGGEFPRAQSTCVPPSGCARTDAACQCVEWQIISVETVPIRYVVVGIVYPPLGNESSVAYGHDRLGVPPVVASDLGARWRSVIRGADGSEKVATIVPGSVGSFGWTFSPVTATTGALAQPANEWMQVQNNADLYSPEVDTLFVWINPAAVVETDAAGGKFIRWSSAPSCIDGSPCVGARIFRFAAGWLDGTITTANPNVQATIDALTPAERSAILAYDPRFNPPGRDPSAVAADARFRSAGTAQAMQGGSVFSSPRWTPCATALTDDSFTGFAAAGVPFGQGETLVLQHSLLATAASCPAQQPSLQFGTSTAGCGIGANVFVDTMFGTLLMVPTGMTASCTSGMP